MKRKNVRTEHSSVLIACLFVFAVLFVCLPPKAKAQYQPPDSCLDMIWKHDPDYGRFNPDSVLTDTCINSPTYQKNYAKDTFLIQIKNGEYIFNQKPVPVNTFITIDAIDTSYSLTKQGFEELEAIYGRFQFLRSYPQESDSIHLLNPIFWIFFDKYVCIDTAKYYLRNIDNITGTSYLLRFGKQTDGIKEEMKIPLSDTTIMTNYFPLNFSTENDFIIDAQIFNITGNLIPDNVEIIYNNRIRIKYLNNGIYFILINQKFLIKLIVW